jgi:serine-type D-Ala-D-Ala carboxypeptidase (penicillin-binding protein 5/6)
VLPAGAPPLPADVTATSWLLADLDTGAVLAAKDPHGRHRPASTIKVLTALVVLRTLDLRKVVVATEADAAQRGSKVGIGPSGQYTVDQLLHGLLMQSGNDAAHALAMQFGGLPQALAAMNGLAAQLGALDTRASTPSGLDAPGTSTSAYDLALFFRLAMRDPAFAAIVRKRQIDFPGFAGKPGFVVSNDNSLLTGYPGAIGGKTGFTNDSRHTYVGAAERAGRRLVVVLLRGEQQPVRMWEQAARMLDYGFALPRRGEPVGVLVDKAPTAAPAPAPVPTSTSKTSAPKPTTTAAPSAPSTEQPVAPDPQAAAGTDADPPAPSRPGALHLAATLLLIAVGAAAYRRLRRRGALR